MNKSPYPEKRYWFVNFYEDIRTSAMAFGYDCGEGWYPLIEELFDKISELIDTKYPEVKTDSEYPFKVVQVKEKFGGLRVYAYNMPDEIADLIDEYEEKSYEVCEWCGKSGSMREVHGWYTTLCDECFEEREKK